MILCCTVSVALCGEKVDSSARAARVLVKDNIRLVRSFLQYFEDAGSEHWYASGRDWLVKFTISNRQARALFTNDGFLVYSILFGTEKDLPEDILQQVRNNYSGYRITKTSKVKENKRTIWVVQMIKDKQHLIVRLEDGDMEEVQEFRED